jgi:hypothetical protein
MDTLFTPTGQTDAHTLLAVAAFFRSHPDGLVKVGVWPETTWNAGQFREWFHTCLMEKISFRSPCKGRKTTRQYQLEQRLDAQVINEFHGRRIVRRGRNILRTPEMRRRYPQINNPPLDD